MKSIHIKRIVCLLCALALGLALSACGKEKSAKVNVSQKASSNVGKVTSEGYELPYTYPDGYVAVAKIVDGSTYKTVESTELQNTRYWLTTSKSVDEVQAFYDEYFKTLQPVKAKKTTDKSVAYFDKDKRIIISNLTVWTADNETNYKFGIEPCEKLEDSTIWEAK